MTKLLVQSLVILGGLSGVLPVRAADSKLDAIERERKVEIERIWKQEHEDLRAQVTKIGSSEGGNFQVVFHADGRYLPGSDYPEKVAKLSRDYVLVWREPKRPMPWVIGTKVRLQVHGNDVISVGCGAQFMKYFRQRSDGKVEILVYMAGHPILVDAHRLGAIDAYNFDLDWVKGVGIVFTAWDAGAGDVESETIKARNTGIVPANAPGVNIQLGRDGWRDIQAWKTAHPKDNLRALIPAVQRIWCAG